MPPSSRPAGPSRYTSWNQISGYFDGDGNVGLEVAKRVLRLKVRFVGTWRQQIDSVARFLAHNGIASGTVGKDEKRGSWQAAYRLDIVEVESVAKAAEAMRSSAVKKRIELQVVVEHLEGRITSNQAIEAFNDAVRVGRLRKGQVGERPIHERRGTSFLSLRTTARPGLPTPSM